MRIFWSWQSDNHQPSGRYFVRDVLTELVAELNGVDAAEDADRPDTENDEEIDESRVRVDHDTLDVAGSPPIAETILRKIREAAVFVADVTPVGRSPAGKLLPNPNVMIELGYAMLVLEHERIVLVMNQAEGAALRHLPFDLRHWRGPIAYSLRRDAPDERRLEVAASLKEDLRERIVPSLKVAERFMREDRRRTHRAPDLHLVLDPAIGSGPTIISQRGVSLGVKSLDEIKKATPLQPLPSIDVSVARAIASPPRLNSSLASFGYKKPVSQWTREEVTGYNGWVESFYRDYATYLDAHADHVRLLMRSVEMKLLVTNEGTLPATGIDVEITFPLGVALYDGYESLPKAPDAPEPPPFQPMGPNHAFARAMPAELPSLVMPRRSSSTLVYPESRCVLFHTDELKHHHQIAIDPFVILFESPADIQSFDIAYSITANEPIDPIEGNIWFEINLENEDG